MLKKILQAAGMQTEEQRKSTLRRKMMAREAQIGGELFGPMPNGGTRQFFCLDEHTWIWHEQWHDKTGKPQIRTTRYEIRPSGIVKAQDGQPYQMIDNREALRLADAVKEYERRVIGELYQSAVPA